MSDVTGAETLGLDLEREIEWLSQLDQELKAALSQSSQGLSELQHAWNRDMGLASAARTPSPFELQPEVIAAKALRVGADWSPALLTPSLLEHSPDLDFVGRLHER